MKRFLFALLLISLGSCTEDFDPPFIEALLDGESPNIKNIESIHKEDKLYNYLGLVSGDMRTELMEVGCIEFIYPFTLFQFDENDSYINKVSILGNENFAELLGNLQDGYSIGLSYPISGNLKDGTPLNVNSNEELQKSLETCIEEKLEIILGACNSIAEECVWKVTESDPEESVYIDSIFTLNEDGSTTLSIPKEGQQESQYDMLVGTWIFYFIGPDLHLNINFGPLNEDDSTETISEKVKADWNFDWKVVCIVDDRIEIEKMHTKMNSDSSEEVVTDRIVLQKECEKESEETDCVEFLSTASDSACCLSGKSSVSPGETEVYTYSTNVDSPQYTWEVISGDIEIIQGDNSSQATFKFGDDFTSGVIEAVGMGSEKGCGTQQTIIRNNLSCSDIVSN